MYVDCTQRSYWKTKWQNKYTPNNKLTFNIDNKLVSNKREIVNYFNNYLSKIGLSTSDNMFPGLKIT